MGLKDLITELRRRKVFRAAAVYIVAAWVAVQVAAQFFPAIGVPAEAIRYVWLITLFLFPIALVFSWRYDVSLDGVTRTPPAEPGDNFDPSLRKMDAVLLVVLAAVALSITLQFGLRIESRLIELNDSINPFSIAVLPLDDLSGNPDEQFFVSGMQSSLIDGLSRVRNLRVTSKVSTMPYRETGGSILEIATQLGVARVVEGTVLRNGNQVSIALRMHDAQKDEQVWSARFEDDIADIMYLQAKAAQEIANQVRVQLGPEEHQHFVSAKPVNPDAYLAVLRGIFHVERFNPEDMRIAATHFQRAVEIDPDYAMGYWGLAKLCGFQAQAGMMTPEDARTRCFPPILRALELDPLLPEAHMGIASLKTWQSFDWDGARPHWERALELNPSLAEAHMFYSHYLGIVGELDKSTEHIELAVRLDPNNPFVIGIYSIQLLMRNEYERSVEIAEKALNMAPGYAFGYITLVLAHHMLGNEEESVAAMAAQLRNIADMPEAATLLESTFAEEGYAQANLKLAEYLVARSSSGHIPPMAIANYYEQGGDYDRAMEWFNKAYEMGDPDMPYFGVNVKDPQMRQHPGFKDLLTKMGLTFWAENL